MVALTQSDWRPYEQGTSGHWGRGRAPCDQVDSCLQAQDRGLGQALPHQGASEGASLAGAWISDSLPWGLGGHHCPPSWLPHLWGRSPKLTDAHGSLSPSDPGERCPQGAEHMQRACPGSRGHRPRPRSRPAPCLVLLPWGWLSQGPRDLAAHGRSETEQPWPGDAGLGPLGRVLGPAPGHDPRTAGKGLKCPFQRHKR